MKKIIVLFFIVSIFCSYSCSTDDSTQPNTENQEQNNPNNDTIANATSQLCEGITGATAIYWDYAHGLPVPLTQIPVITDPGGQFIHSMLPLLGFTVPQGYTAFEILDNQTAAIGVNVIRNDNAAIWRYLPTLTLQGNVTTTDVITAEINGMFDFFNFNGDFTVLCSESSTTDNLGLITNFTSRLLRFGDFTALVTVHVHQVSDLNVSFISSSVSAAPTAEYNDIIFDTYLPISFELLFIDDDVRDSDLDGTPDNQDSAPFDPTQQ